MDKATAIGAYRPITRDEAKFIGWIVGIRGDGRQVGVNTRMTPLNAKVAAGLMIAGYLSVRQSGEWASLKLTEDGARAFENRPISRRRQRSMERNRGK